LSVPCPACNKLMVRSSREPCAPCRDKGFKGMERVVTTYRRLDTEEVDAYELLQGALRLSRESMRRIEAQMMATGEDGELLEPGVRRDLNREMVAMNKALAIMAKEARQFEVTRQTAAGKLSYEDKRELMAEFFEVMPDEHQRALIEQLTQAFNEGKKVRSIR
jgi:5'(3')-deoxyribonucleotidase